MIACRLDPQYKPMTGFTEDHAGRTIRMTFPTRSRACFHRVQVVPVDMSISTAALRRLDQLLNVALQPLLFLFCYRNFSLAHIYHVPRTQFQLHTHTCCFIL